MNKEILKRIEAAKEAAANKPVPLPRFGDFVILPNGTVGLLKTLFVCSRCHDAVEQLHPPRYWCAACTKRYPLRSKTK